MLSVSYLSFLIVFMFADDSNTENIATVTVATYNVWNVMFNWDVRKFRIAKMIKDVNPHIIAFQELRSDAQSSVDQDDVAYNQLSDLQSLLPVYRWKHYAVAHVVPPVIDSYITHWNYEGVGILSRLPIVRHEVQNLTARQSPDKNNRVALHVQVLLDQAYYPDTSQVMNVAVVHLSYDKQQQCNNALEIYQYIHEKRLKNSVILGDFNTYKNFESPPMIFTRSRDANGPNVRLECTADVQERLARLTNQRQAVYDDVWIVGHPGDPGFTFSNMPKPGLESRPDRILYNAQYLQPVSSGLTGDGTVYKARFLHHVLWNRMQNLRSAAYDSSAGRRGRSCAYDCGPHASCRCGLCVSGTDYNHCHLPLCEECTAKTYYTIVVFTVVFVLLLAQLLFGVLQVMLAMNKRGQMNVARPVHKYLVCCNFCLCDPQMYSNMSVKVRSMKRRTLCKIWPVLRLPPMWLVIVSVVMVFLFGEFVLFSFNDAITNIYAITPEELNPSDHRMLFAELRLNAVNEARV